jgi:hypothetical protein
MAVKMITRKHIPKESIAKTIYLQNKLVSSNKGYFFSLIVVFLLALSALVLFSATTVISTTNEDANTLRFSTIESFIYTVKKDSSQALHIASLRSLLFIQEEMIREGDYLKSVDDIIESLILRGIYVKNSITEEPAYLAKSAMHDWQENIIFLGNAQNMKVAFANHNIILEQSSPWELIISINTTMTIDDLLTDASWNLPYIAKTTIPITQLVDPVSIVGTYSRYPKTLTQCPFETMSVNDCLEQQQYIVSAHAPSYLSRLRGDMQSDTYGILTTVSIPDLASDDIFYISESVIDWQYFEEVEGVATCHVQGQSSWFRIDQEVAIELGVTCN